MGCDPGNFFWEALLEQVKEAADRIGANTVCSLTATTVLDVDMLPNETIINGFWGYGNFYGTMYGVGMYSSAYSIHRLYPPSTAYCFAQMAISIFVSRCLI